MIRIGQFALVFALCISLKAQEMQMPAGLNEKVPFLAAALSEFISDSRSFVATAELRVPAAPGEQPIMLPFDVAMRNGKMRWDLNLLKSSALPAESAGFVKQLGLDRIVLLMEPNQKMIVAFPTLKTYLEQAPPKDQAIEDKAVNKLGRFVKTAIGKETIDGHPCTKYRLSDPKQADKEQAVVWQADDLKDFPVRLQVRMQEDVYDFRFRNVQLGEPEERAFARPVGYTKYESTEALMAGIMAKSLGDAKGLLGGQ